MATAQQVEYWRERQRGTHFTDSLKDENEGAKGKREVGVFPSTEDSMSKGTVVGESLVYLRK